MTLPVIDYTQLTDSEVAQLKSEATLEQDRRLRIAEAPAKAEAVSIEYLQDAGQIDGADWVQPTGAHDCYPLGYTVTFDGKLWESLITANTTVPGSDPRWWKDLTTVVDPNAWDPNYKSYLVGDIVTYETKSYDCLQEHVSQPGWDPVSVPALWHDQAIVNPPVDPEVPITTVWSSDSVAYKVNDRVTYSGITYTCQQDHTSQAGWTPEAVPALWVPA
jgi:hypothetical protein